MSNIIPGIVASGFVPAVGGTIYANEAAAVTDGLIHYWKLDEAVAANPTPDEVSGGPQLNHTSAPAVVTGATNLVNARDYDDLNDYSTAASTFSVGSQYTVGCIGTFDNLNDNEVILSFGDSGANQRSMSFFMDKSGPPIERMQIELYDPGNNANFEVFRNNTTTLLTATRYFFLFDVDASAASPFTTGDINLFINGTSEALLQASGGSMNANAHIITSDTLRLSNYMDLGPSGVRSMDGVIDEVFIFNDLIANLTLTASNWYNGGAGRQLF